MAELRRVPGRQDGKKGPLGPTVLLILQKEDGRCFVLSDEKVHKNCLFATPALLQKKIQISPQPYVFSVLAAMIVPIDLKSLCNCVTCVFVPGRIESLVKVELSLVRNVQ